MPRPRPSEFGTNNGPSPTFYMYVYGHTNVGPDYGTELVFIGSSFAVTTGTLCPATRSTIPPCPTSETRNRASRVVDSPLKIVT